MQWTQWFRVVVLVQRKPVTKTEMVFDTGVNSDRTKKTLTYNGELQTVSFANDWGPGLINYKLEEWDTTTPPGAWGPSNNITLVDRPAAGTGTHGTMTFGAIECGKYRITITPSNYWKDGTRTPLVYEFEIEKIKLERPSLIAEDGVTGNKKFVNDTGMLQYISMAPVLSKYMELDKGSLSQTGGGSDEGLVTLAGMDQGVYTITVKLKNPQTPGTGGSGGGSGGTPGGGKIGRAHV